jgi:hypothetical protein
MSLVVAGQRCSGYLVQARMISAAAIIKNRLKRIQYRPSLIEAFLAQTGLTLEPQLRRETVECCEGFLELSRGD